MIECDVVQLNLASVVVTLETWLHNQVAQIAFLLRPGDTTLDWCATDDTLWLVESVKHSSMLGALKNKDIKLIKH